MAAKINFNQKGASIIAVIAIMLILAVMGAALVSLVTTGSDVSVNQLQSEQALYIAEGGLEFAEETNNFPNFDVASTNLGNGSFTVTVPTLSADITAATTGPITVFSTDGFIPNPGDATNYWIMLCGVTGTPRLDLTASSTCEKMSFSGKTATTFTGGTRGRDSSSTVAHPGNATPSLASVVLMYSWDTAKTTTIATRDLARNDKCTTAATTICVTSTTNFADPGFIRINDADENSIEDVFYSGIGTGAVACGAGCAACLGTNGCTRRAYDGNNKGTVRHVIGTNIWQSEITALPQSTGVVSNAQRVVQGTVSPLY